MEEIERKYREFYDYYVKTYPVELVDLTGLCAGAATNKVIFVNSGKTSINEIGMFVLLHELAHFLSFKKNNIPFHFYHEKDVDEMLEYIILEEKRADRFARIMYRKVFGKDVSKHIWENRYYGLDIYKKEINVLKFNEKNKQETYEDYHEYFCDVFMKNILSYA